MRFGKYLQETNQKIYFNRHRHHLRLVHQRIASIPRMTHFSTSMELRSEFDVVERWRGAVGWFRGDVSAIWCVDSGTKLSLEPPSAAKCGRDRDVLVQPGLDTLKFAIRNHQWNWLRTNSPCTAASQTLLRVSPVALAWKSFGLVYFSVKLSTCCFGS